MQKVSANFTLLEFYRSTTAERLKINNFPPATVMPAMRALCSHVLEPLRALLRLKFSPRAVIAILSGYRCPLLNFAVGGQKNSQHKRAMAADINVPGMTPQQLFDFILASGIQFDQIIQEFDEWVHISFSTRCRRSVLYAWRDEAGEPKFTTTPPPAGWKTKIAA